MSKNSNVMMAEFPGFTPPVGLPAEKTLNELRDFAMKEENWKKPQDMTSIEALKDYTRDVVIPCEEKHEHVMHVIFTITVAILQKADGSNQREEPARQLSISMDDRMHFPAPEQVYAAAAWLGYTGKQEDWHVQTHPVMPGTVVLVQPINKFPDNVQYDMYVMQGGQKRTEFMPQAVTDPAGKRQMLEVVVGIKYRKALDKLAAVADIDEKYKKEIIEFFMGLFNGQNLPISDEAQMACQPFFLSVDKADLTDTEANLILRTVQLLYPRNDGGPVVEG